MQKFFKNPLWLILFFILESHIIKYYRLLTDGKKGTTNFIDILGFKYAFSFQNPENIPILTTLIFAVGIGLIVYFRYQTIKKQSSITHHVISIFGTFIRTFKAEVGNGYGLTLLVFLVVHIAWLPSTLFDFLKGEEKGWIPAFIFLCMIVPFVIAKVQPKEAKPTKEERKVLITPLSLPSSKEQITAGWSNNWLPVKRILHGYFNINKVIILLTKDVSDLLPTSINESKKNYFEELFKTELSRDIEVEIIDITSDVNEFEVLYLEIKTKLKETLGTTSDKEILINMTSGTVPFSISLSFIEMRGGRGGVYDRQNKVSSNMPEEEAKKMKSETKGIVELPISIYTIDELWQEIIDVATSKKENE